MFECEVLDGLKACALAEIEEKLPKARIRETGDPARILLRAKGEAATVYNILGQLRTVVTVYETHYYDVPRPKAMLGHQYFSLLKQQIEKVLDSHPKGTFQTFTINAAGRDSSVFQRLRDELQKVTGLEFQPEEADLHLRFRRSKAQETGWDVMIRLTPRPNSARAWRVSNMPGALNASVAAAMVRLSNPTPQDRYLNLMSGSGTLLIERLLHGPAAQAVGVEIKHNALEAAKANTDAAGLSAHVKYIQHDATQVQLPANSFDVIVSDPPWGQLVGEQRDLEILYEKLLNEIYRLGTQDVRVLLLSHGIQKMMGVLKQQAEHWLLLDEVKIKQGGLHPHIYVLKKRG